MKSIRHWISLGIIGALLSLGTGAALADRPHHRHHDYHYSGYDRSCRPNYGYRGYSRPYAYHRSYAAPRAVVIYREPRYRYHPYHEPVYRPHYRYERHPVSVNFRFGGHR